MAEESGLIDHQLYYGAPASASKCMILSEYTLNYYIIKQKRRMKSGNKAKNYKLKSKSTQTTTIQFTKLLSIGISIEFTCC